MFFSHIPQEDFDKYPKFADLISQLKAKLSPNGSSLHLEKNLQQTKHNLQKARHNWLQQHILHTQLSELLADLEVKGLDGGLSLAEGQYKEVLTRALSHSELPDYLSFLPDPNCQSTLFGLSTQDLERHNPVSQHIPALQQTTIPLLEQRLRAKCEKIYNFYQTEQESQNISGQLLVTKTTSLPAVIEQKIQALEKRKLKLEETYLARMKQFWLYYQKLLESISLMKELLQEHRLRSQSEVDHVNISWLKLQCDALYRKVQLTKLQILTRTYDEETLKALDKISHTIDRALRHTQQELSATKYSLTGYHSVGEEFSSLVSEFTRLQKEVDTRKWGLQKLGVWAGADGSQGGADSLGQSQGAEGGLSLQAKPPKSSTRSGKLTKKVSFGQSFDRIEETGET